MSILIPFDQCIARPNDGDKLYFLKDHLIGARKIAEDMYKKEDVLIDTLVGLADLCHDVPKAHQEWQAYASKEAASRRKGPSHAPGGALLFSYLAYHLFISLGQWDAYKIYWLWLIRDINDHHGQLKTIGKNDCNWISADGWDKMDMGGIAEFIKQQYPVFADIDISEAGLKSWSDEVFDVFEEALDVIDLGYKKPAVQEIMDILQRWRCLTVNLVAGDRFDITNTVSAVLNEKDHLVSAQSLDKFCKDNRPSPLTPVRIEAQKNIIAQLEQNPDETIYTLEMPTGYGKTITALKMASWLGLNRGYQKIIYVAPYLSILEQTSRVIGEAMQRIALEHHSLAIIDQDEHKKAEARGTIHQSGLTMEAWAHSIVCTSFQQFSKALFPGRAQDVLRRSFLHNTVVIIDEPQIFNPEDWNVFLIGLESMAQIYNLRIIFLSATMPPFHFGLTKNPCALSVSSHKTVERYKIVKYKDLKEIDEEELVQFVQERKEQKQAVILNTIRDAYEVFKALGESKTVELIHGMMIPLHKKMKIAKIQQSLEDKKKKMIVISTQILEAGVDVSFQHVIRALSILPSIVQSAGRVNRHGDELIGILSLVNFFREGRIDTRTCIYAKALQEITDTLLKPKEEWYESDALQLIKVYYQEMFQRNTYEAGKQAIYEAYEGNWPQLSDFHPFGKQEFMRLPVFIPWDFKEAGLFGNFGIDSKLAQFIQLRKKFGFENSEDIYHFYSEKKRMHALSFEARKEFMILFHYFVVNVPVDLAFNIADRDAYVSNLIPRIYNKNEYSSVIGLAARMIDGFDPYI